MRNWLIGMALPLAATAILCALALVLAPAAMAAKPDQPPSAEQLAAFSAAKTVSLDWLPEKSVARCVAQRRGGFPEEAQTAIRVLVSAIVRSHELQVVPENGDLRISIGGCSNTLAGLYLRPRQYENEIYKSVIGIFGTHVEGEMVLSAARAKPYHVPYQGMGGSDAPAKAEVPAGNGDKPFGSACLEEAVENAVGAPLRKLFLSFFGDTNPATLRLRGCEAGDAGSCTDLARLYDAGDGVAPDKAMAARFYQKGCDGGASLSCANLGWLYDVGQGVAEDKVKAAQLLGKGCDAGQPAGCANLGVLYETGQGVPRDKAKAAELYQKGCDRGAAAGCANLGVLYNDGQGVTQGVTQDKAKAAQLLQKGCDGGAPAGCTALGVMHADGQGVAEDKVKAVQLFAKACDAGDAAGCSNLGFMHSTGQGAAQDKAKAARLFQIACGRGFAMGCTNLALMYEKGDGVAQDLAQAVALYQRACTNGLAAGCDAVKLAVQLFRDGCDAGTALRCANLADLYARGLGVEASKGEAVRLYQGACQKGIARACVALRSLQ